MRAVADGEPDAQRTLVTRLFHRVNGRVHRLSRHDSAADDLTQDVLLQVLRSAGCFRGTGCIEAWVDAITVRTVSKRLSRLRRLRWLLGGTLFELASPDAGPEQSLCARTRCARVQHLLRRLPREWQEALLLKLAYGYQAREVAQLTGRTLKETQYHIKRGRAELRRLAIRDAQLRDLAPLELPTP